MTALWRFVLLLMIVVTVCLAVAPFTGSGSQALLALVARYTPVEIDYQGGTISGVLQLDRLAFKSDGLELEVTGVLAELAPGCFWRSVFCFRQLQLGKLAIDLLPDAEQASTESPETAPDQDSTLFVFPVQLEADLLTVGATQIVWQSGEWRQGRSQLGLRIRESSVEIFEAVFSGATLDLRESGPPADTERLLLGRIDLPLNLSVDGLILEQPAWNFYGSRHQLQRMSLRGSWRNTQLYVEELTAGDADWGALSLQGDMAFAGDWPLQLSSEISLAQPPVWQGVHSRLLSVSAGGSLADLALQLKSPGSPELFAEARLDVLDRQLPFESSLQLKWPEGLRLGEIEGTPVALAEVVLEAPVQALVRGNSRSQLFELHGEASGLGYQSLGLSATGSVEGGQVTVQDFLLLDESGASELRGSGELAMADPLKVSLELNSTGFELPQLEGSPRGRLQGGFKADASLHDNTWWLALAEVGIEGTINDFPARVSGHAAIGNDLVLGNSDLHAEFNGTLLQVNSPGGNELPGHFELSLEDLGRWQPGSRGMVHVSGTFAADARHLQFEGRLQDIQWQSVSIDHGELSGDYRTDPGQSSQLDLTLTELTLGELALDSVRLLVGGTPQSHTLSLVSEGELQGELALAGAFSERQWAGRLAATNLQTPHGSWRLPKPVDIAWSDDTGHTVLAAHCWQQQSTRICPGELQLGAQSSGSVSVDGDLGFLSGLMPEGVELQGDLQLRLKGSWDTTSGLVINGESTTRTVQLTRLFAEGELATLRWDNGATIIAYNSDGLRLQWEAQREGRRVLELDLLLPPQRDGDLSGSMQFRDLRLATLAPLLPMLSTLDGNLSGQLRLAGSASQPLAHGELTLSGGRIALVGNSTPLNSLELRLELLGDKGTLSGSGNLGQGELQLSGEMFVRPQWGMSLSVEGQKHNILYPPSTQMLVSESLVITASAGLLDIKGEVVVHEGVLKPDELPPGSVAVSADVVEVDYAGNVIKQELPFDLSMDVWFRIQDRFKVTGTLINATLGGDLHLLQRRNRPLQLFGNLNIIGGEFRAYQQSLQIKRGSLHFTGRTDNPALDVRAQRDISGSNVKVGVQVQGTFDAMILEVFSDPAMAQGEAMSYLVRGRGLDASTGEDGTALAISLASGVVNRSTVVAELNRIPGLNNIAFGAQGSEDDTAATMSGYIGNRIYLSYGIGLYEPINVLTARLYLSTRLWLEVVSRLENSVDLYYSFDID